MRDGEVSFVNKRMMGGVQSGLFAGGVFKNYRSQRFFAFLAAGVNLYKSKT
jgi:hypothetical protein